MTLQDALVWIDCEMTGLDTSKDCLVEVAVIITDAQLNVVDEGIDLIIRPKESSLASMGDFVRKMHTKSGLMDQLADGMPIEEAQVRVLDYIRRFVPEPGKAMLAGNSVGTDKSFLEKEMPQVINHLHYRLIDVSTVKELAKRWMPRVYFNMPAKNLGHRALADIQESIAELRYYRSIFFVHGDGPSTDDCKARAHQVSACGVGPNDLWPDMVKQLAPSPVSQG